MRKEILGVQKALVYGQCCPQCVAATTCREDSPSLHCVRKPQTVKWSLKRPVLRRKFGPELTAREESPGQWYRVVVTPLSAFMANFSMNFTSSEYGYVQCTLYNQVRVDIGKAGRTTPIFMTGGPLAIGLFTGYQCYVQQHAFTFFTHPPPVSAHSPRCFTHPRYVI